MPISAPAMSTSKRTLTAALEALPGDVVLLEGGVVCLHSWERTPQTPKTAIKRRRLPVHSLVEQLSMTASKSSATYSDLP